MLRLVAWGALAALGAAAFAIALGFGFGRGAQVGSAAVPLVLAAALVAVAGLGLLARPDGSEAPPEGRPFLAVAAAVLLFALTVEPLGLVPATLATMAAAYAGQSERRLAGFALYAVLFAAGVWLVFTVGLGVPLPAFAWS